MTKTQCGGSVVFKILCSEIAFTSDCHVTMDPVRMRTWVFLRDYEIIAPMSFPMRDFVVGSEIEMWWK